MFSTGTSPLAGALKPEVLRLVDSRIVRGGDTAEAQRNAGKQVLAQAAPDLAPESSARELWSDAGFAFRCAPAPVVFSA